MLLQKKKKQLFKWGWRGWLLPGSVLRRMDGYVTPIPFVCAQSVVPVCEHTANYSADAQPKECHLFQHWRDHGLQWADKGRV